VISRRRQLGSAATAGIPDMLYQNDGVYGNFMNVIMEKEIMVPHLVGSKKGAVSHKIKTNDESEKPDGHRYSIWGPTCDSTDCVVREVTLDSEVEIGDWLKYKNMGGE
jgi:ornithine decarboxylase